MVLPLSHDIENKLFSKKTEAKLLALVKIKPEYSFLDHVAKALGIETLGVKIILTKLIMKGYIIT
ncbi:hypothetical protein AV650_26715 [Serratia fonticola]|nr:hypothetical protein AV650_26715 [Serratia fonticola]